VIRSCAIVVERIDDRCQRRQSGIYRVSGHMCKDVDGRPGISARLRLSGRKDWRPWAAQKGEPVIQHRRWLITARFAASFH